MKVLFAASECTPLAKVGGLGDVIGSLPKALARLGVQTSIVLPFYESISRRIWRPVLRIKNYESGISGQKVNVYETKLPQSNVRVYLIENKQYLSRGPIYFEKTAFAGSQKEIDRFMFFSQSVFTLLQKGFFKPDVVHCNDWHTGFLVKLLKSKSKKPKMVFTIHNLANQGALGGVNWMAEGIKNADIVTTVSAAYAKEITTKQYGAGLENLLKKRSSRGELAGILNGIDYSFWPPESRNKMRFQKEFRLAVNGKAPVFGLVSRLTRQKGIRLILPLINDFVRKGGQFAFLGQGEEEIEEGLKKAMRANPESVFVKIGFSEKLARRIYAQSDFFLMPSRFEPSGLGQMIAMHYGTIPIVRATGGLKDSVKHLKTGFVFKKESSADLKKAMELAVKYFDNHKKLAVIRQNCLRQDFSWSRSARKYKLLYTNLLK